MSYLLKVIKHMSLKKLNAVINEVHEKTGKSKVFIFFDIVSLAIFHGGGYYDYRIFRLYEYTNAQRATMVTRLRNKRLIAFMNDPNYSYIFDVKSVFNERFKDYLKRDFIVVDKSEFADFERFISDKEVIFAKPNSMESGKGIERLKKADFADLTEMWSYIKSAPNGKPKFDLLEEQIIQHPDFARLHPNSVNTLRIVTLVTADRVAHAVYCTLKMGNSGKFVDNLENDGLCCPVDMETGVVNGVGHTSRLVNFDEHPYSGVKFVGYQLPFIPDALELAKKAALEVPEMRYIGWDVFVGENGPGIIEGNDYPGYDFSQLPEHNPQHTGLWSYYKSLLPGLK